MVQTFEFPGGPGEPARIVSNELGTCWQPGCPMNTFTLSVTALSDPDTLIRYHAELRFNVKTGERL